MIVIFDRWFYFNILSLFFLTFFEGILFTRDLLFHRWFLLRLFSISSIRTIFVCSFMRLCWAYFTPFALLFVLCALLMTITSQEREFMLVFDIENQVLLEVIIKVLYLLNYFEIFYAKKSLKLWILIVLSFFKVFNKNMMTYFDLIRTFYSHV